MVMTVIGGTIEGKKSYNFAVLKGNLRRGANNEGHTTHHGCTTTHHAGGLPQGSKLTISSGTHPRPRNATHNNSNNNQHSGDQHNTTNYQPLITNEAQYLAYLSQGNEAALSQALHNDVQSAQAHLPDLYYADGTLNRNSFCTHDYYNQREFIAALKSMPDYSNSMCHHADTVARNGTRLPDSFYKLATPLLEERDKQTREQAKNEYRGVAQLPGLTSHKAARNALEASLATELATLADLVPADRYEAISYACNEARESDNCSLEGMHRQEELLNALKKINALNADNSCAQRFQENRTLAQIQRDPSDIVDFSIISLVDDHTKTMGYYRHELVGLFHKDQIDYALRASLDYIVQADKSIVNHASQLRDQGNPVEALSLIECCRNVQRAGRTWFEMTKNYLKESCHGVPLLSTAVGAVTGALEGGYSSAVEIIHSGFSMMHVLLQGIANQQAMEQAGEYILAAKLVRDPAVAAQLSAASAERFKSAERRAQQAVEMLKPMAEGINGGVHIARNLGEIMAACELAAEHQAPVSTYLSPEVRKFARACATTFNNLDDFDRGRLAGNIAGQWYGCHAISQACRQVTSLAALAQENKTLNLATAIDKEIAYYAAGAPGSSSRNFLIVHKKIGQSGCSKAVTDRIKKIYYSNPSGDVASSSEVGREIKALKESMVQHARALEKSVADGRKMPPHANKPVIQKSPATPQRYHSHPTVNQALHHLHENPSLAATCGGTEKVIERITECEKILKDKPGFCTGKENVIERISKAGGEAGVRGPLYEAESAVVLEKEGTPVKSLGTKVKSAYDSRDIDIMTDKLAIECKDYDWSNENRFKQFRDDIGRGKKVVESALPDKQYCIYSNNPLPAEVKKWLTTQGVLYRELKLI